MSEPKNGWRKWSDQEEAFILSLIKEGLSLAEIAARVPFRSKSAVYSRITTRKALYLAWRETADLRRRNAAKSSEFRITPTVTLSDIAIIVSAVCSFATLVLLSLVVAFA
tara:strand:+ start:418 stop:747 length:330 start_codon:yes stop_codon:yes gene_type:complete